MSGRLVGVSGFQWVHKIFKIIKNWKIEGVDSFLSDRFVRRLFLNLEEKFEEFRAVRF